MARKQRVSKGKTMRPNYFVFCEGETEEAYVGILRAHYRAPIHIITKRTLLNITAALVTRIKAAYVCTKNDRTFLMYDLDVPTMLGRLKKIPGATLLCSNPCLELWLLFHYAEQKSEMTSKECVEKLVSFVPSYHKGLIEPGMKQVLLQNVVIAVERAKTLDAYSNPSTTVYGLIEALGIC
ncbi:MAG: RloB domain-containing protein [Bacteroidaceae bacterium]|nr:RloB domain-containing protein [Bacteroidaceae bacterium]